MWDTPRVERSGRVVPNSADGNTGNCSNAPPCVSVEEVCCNPNIGESTDTTGQAKHRPSLQPAPSPQTNIAICNNVVKCEVDGHGGEDSKCLALGDAPVQSFEKSRPC